MIILPTIRRCLPVLFVFCFLFFSTLVFAEDSKNSEQDSTNIDVERLDILEERLRELESRAVLSEPELLVKQKEIFVCNNGHEYNDGGNGKCPLDGLPLAKSFTYQREKVYRRQTISEKIEEVLAGEARKGVSIGISSTATVQDALRLKGNSNEVNGDLFGVGSLDIFFIAKPALYTMFFVDVEAIGGYSPDTQIENISGLTSDSARRTVSKDVNVDGRIDGREMNLREAWLSTELLGQRLTITGGILDLTNYFDSNTVANDETTQFITDTLVNNPLLAAPGNNGGGLTAVFDSKTGLIFKVGLQRGENAMSNLEKKNYSVFEVDYLSHFRGLPEGHYRLWYRINESTNREDMAWGTSIDQKLTSSVTLFGRFGQQFTSKNVNRDDFFYSAGVQFKTPHVFGIQDAWAVGFQSTDLASSGEKETLVEGYYNLFLTDNLRTSFHIQYLADSNVGGANKSYMLPGMRVQLDF